MSKRAMILAFLKENPDGTYRMFGKDKGVARQYFDSVKRAAQISKTLPTVEMTAHPEDPFKEIHILETCEHLIDQIIAGKSDIKRMIQIRRSIGKRIIELENLPK